MPRTVGDPPHVEGAVAVEHAHTGDPARPRAFRPRYTNDPFEAAPPAPVPPKETLAAAGEMLRALAAPVRIAIVLQLRESRALRPRTRRCSRGHAAADQPAPARSQGRGRGARRTQRTRGSLRLVDDHLAHIVVDAVAHAEEGWNRAAEHRAARPENVGRSPSAPANSAARSPLCSTTSRNSSRHRNCTTNCASAVRESGSPPSTARCRHWPTPERSTYSAPTPASPSTGAAPPDITITWCAAHAGSPSRSRARRSSSGRRRSPSDNGFTEVSHTIEIFGTCRECACRTR